MTSDRLGITDETVAIVLSVQHMREKLIPCSTLEVYNKTPIFIPVDIMKDVVKSVPQKKWGFWAPVVQTKKLYRDVFLKLRDNSKNLCIGVEIFMYWIANQYPPRVTYCAFMSGRLITLDKQLGIFPVSIRETWRFLFAKCVMNIVGPKVTNVCQYDHFFSG